MAKEKKEASFDLAQRDREIIKTSIVGILGNVLLVAAKATIGLLVGSIAIVLDAVNNLTDALSSILTIIGAKLSKKAPDKKHPYGYGRIEYLTSFVIAALVLFAGGSAIYESIRGIIADPLCQNPPDYSANHYASLIVVGIAIVGKIALGLYFRAQGKKTNSAALSASGTDALMDSVLSLATLVAAIVALLSGKGIESYLGVAIGLFIVKAGIEILLDAVGEIIGRRADKETTQKLRSLIASYPEVKGVYDIVLNSYGPERIIASAHMEVADDMTAKDIHRLSREITFAAYQQMGIILTLGIYASNDLDERSREIKESLHGVLLSYKTLLQVHGFYVNEAEHLISFDLIFNYEEKEPKKRVEEIRAAMRKLYPDYQVFIILDADISD